MLFKKRKDKGKSLQASSKQKEELLEAIQRLKEELALISAERDDLLKDISTFELKYNKKLGKYLQRILVLRMDKAKSEAEISPEKKQRYKETLNDYENFNKKSRDLEQKKLFSLSEDDLAKLKTIFRRAARKCHPDVVSDKNKEKSQEIFIVLRQAYERNDLEEVMNIAEALKQDKEIETTVVESQELESLNRIRSSIERKIDSTNNEMIELMASETYQIISSSQDMDAYFDNLKEQLEIQISVLENNN